MKILQVIPTISGGGAERFAVDLSNELAEDHIVSLLTLYDPQKEDIFRKDVSVNIASFALSKRPGVDKAVAFRLLKAIRKIKPDIIHNHLRSINYLLPILPFIGKTPVVHTIHNDAFKECPSIRLRKIRKYFFDSGKITPVTISDESQSSFELAYKGSVATLIKNGRSFPLPSPHIQHIKDQIAGYKRDSDTKVFVNIGRMEPQKNQLMLAEAFEKLVKNESANAVLLFVGGGRNTVESRHIQARLEAFAQSGLGIYLLGERPDATDYLYEADFFCLSSTFEGMPISLIEAMAIGAVPVCTPVGGITEMLTEIDASLLSESVSMESYYDTLRRCYQLDKERYSGLQRSGKDLYERKYSIATCAGRYYELYQRLSGNR